MRYCISIIMLLGLLANAIANLSAQEYKSGDAEIDKVRVEVKTQKTTATNFRERHLMLYMWLGALQQQGANTVSYYDLDKKYYQLERVINKSRSFFEMSTGHEKAKSIADDKQSRKYKEAMAQMCETIDKGFEHMEMIQKELMDNGPIFTAFEAETEVTGGDVFQCLSFIKDYGIKIRQDTAFIYQVCKKQMMVYYDDSGA